MAIYTRTGDKGETGLFGGGRTPKSHPRVAAYGEVDELNSALGHARSFFREDPALQSVDKGLERVQGECFVVGALLATPADKLGKLTPPFDTGLPPGAPKRLEAELDAWDKDLTPLKTFILPGGGRAGAALHLARAVARRAERAVVELAALEPVPEGVLVYLNRLSTWLFVAARFVNKETGHAETPWSGLPNK
ncbi:MAG: ATP:cob(I)alamin adenosyltransferase [Elusimicrobia bacterium CG11_big_fil_rev_8_21_14_0_20_64_6]|nr:MAG: ATP:cob(I)alamin adenosyltransferase [Elusimicrobia bacterium CG11_big_fil_rev_8_21_14_0_20_64_6]